MKQIAQSIIISSYNLVASDEDLSKMRAEDRGTSRMSDEKLRAQIIEERVKSLIGSSDAKDSFFIYGRGTVCLSFGSRVICT